MNGFFHVGPLAPMLLCGSNLLFAALLHRVVVLDAELMRRRQFFESLSVVAFAVALLVSLASFLLWRHNAAFVLILCAVWTVLCLGAIVSLRRGARDVADDPLEMIDAWERRSDAAGTTASAPLAPAFGAPRPASRPGSRPAPCPTRHARTAPLAASPRRARPRSPLRYGSTPNEQRRAAALRFSKNRSVYRDAATRPKAPPP